MEPGDCCVIDEDSKDFKTRLKMFHLKYSLVENKLDKKSTELSRIIEESVKLDEELADCKSGTERINERWKSADIEINKLKWMTERASIVRESNVKRNEIHTITMKRIGEKHLELTTRAFKTVRQEAAGVVINTEINNLNDSKKELEQKLFRLRNIKAANENRLAEASMELIEIKSRAGAIIRLRNKLEESETLRLGASKKLHELKQEKFRNNSIDEIQ